MDKSKTNFERAITLSPSQGEYWAHYAWLLGNIRENEKSRRGVQPREAVGAK